MNNKKPNRRKAIFSFTMEFLLDLINAQSDDLPKDTEFIAYDYNYDSDMIRIKLTSKEFDETPDCEPYPDLNLSFRSHWREIEGLKMQILDTSCSAHYTDSIYCNCTLGDHSCDGPVSPGICFHVPCDGKPPAPIIEALKHEIQHLTADLINYRELAKQSAEYLEDLCDEGPAGQGWQSDKLKAHIKTLEEMGK